MKNIVNIFKYFVIKCLRCQGFNKEMEEMQRTQRSYSLPDRQLRDSIKRDNKEFILPKYQAFYDR